MKEKRLNIHIFGGSKGAMRFGESIVIQTPEGRWGIIDCCVGRATYPQQFLDEQKVRELDFVLLTHPHADHFSGLSRILDSLKCGNLAKYSGNSFSGRKVDPEQDSFRFLTEVLGASLSTSLPGDLRQFVSDELTTLLQRRDWPELRAPDELLTEEGSGFKIRAISPTRELCLRLDKQLQKNISSCLIWPDGTSAPMIKPRAAAKRRAKIRSGINRLSVCTHLKWGRFAGLLLADAEKVNLQQAYAKNRAWFDDLSFVKVAHHGGAGANPIIAKGKSLFELIAERTKNDLIAVVTHYHHQLPSSKTLDTIKMYCKEVFRPLPPNLWVNSGSNSY